jgi:hypothetical protein
VPYVRMKMRRFSSFFHRVSAGDTHFYSCLFLAVWSFLFILIVCFADVIRYSELEDCVGL